MTLQWRNTGYINSVPQNGHVEKVYKGVSLTCRLLPTLALLTAVTRRTWKLYSTHCCSISETKCHKIFDILTTMVGSDNVTPPPSSQ